MIKKQLAFIQDWIEHNNVHPLLSHIITYLDPKAVAQFLRCNKQLYYKPVLPLIWTQFITTPNTYTPHHLDLWKTLAIDRFHRDTPCEEDKERLHSLLIEEKPALALQNDYQKLVTEYNTSLRLYRDLQEKPRTLTLDNNQQIKLVTLYRLHKQHFSCSDKDIFPEKAVYMTQCKSFNPDTLYEGIQTDDLYKAFQAYINTNLDEEKETLFTKLKEIPEDNEGVKAAHTADVTDRITNHPLLVYATVTDGIFKGDTPLHWAAYQGHTRVIQILLDAGADPIVTDSDGITPFHWAAREGHTKIVQALLQAKADVTVTTNSGYTPLHLAARNGHTKIAKYLLANRAEMNAIANNGTTPLHLAAHFGRTAVARLLINKGAKVNATANRTTPLQLAINDSLKALLLEAGART